MGKISNNYSNSSPNNAKVRDAVAGIGLGILTALVAPTSVVARLDDPPASSKSKTYTLDEVYAKYTANYKRDLLFWRDAKATDLTFEAQKADLNSKVANATGYFNATKDSKPLDKAKKWLEDLKTAQENHKKEHLDPLKEAFQKSGKKIQVFYAGLSPKSMEIVKPAIQEDIKTVKKTLDQLKDNSPATTDRREAYQYFLTHLEELQKISPRQVQK